MKSSNAADKSIQPQARQHYVAHRLDQSVPLQSEAWQGVEQMLMRLTEFAPQSLIMEAASAIASYADDQAQLGYLLGQEDLGKKKCKRAA